MIGVLYTFLGWWRDVIREAQFDGFHTRVVQISHRYGMILFIASEVMFFVAWFWAYFNTALFPGDAHDVGRLAFTHGVWPPQGHRDLRSLASAAAQHADPADLGHHGDLGASRAAGKRPQGPEMGPGADHPARPDLHLRAGLRILRTPPSTISGNIYGATFFMATGFHGAHVIIGSIFLIVCLIRAYAGHFTPTQHLGFEFAAWYWHFVDVVWLFLFACIYVWGAGVPHRRVTDRAMVHLQEGGVIAPPFFALSRSRKHDRACIDRYAAADRRGLRGRCPRCGEGKLFPGFLTLRPRCERCGLDFDFADAGDGPAVFVILIGGVIVVFAALITEVLFSAAVLGARAAVAAADPDHDAGCRCARSRAC